MTDSTQKTAYHHGNLREALLDSALLAVESGGLDKLSLRGLAKSVGVTPTAVYSHFKDKNDLLIAVHTVGFKQLREAMEQSLTALPKAARGEDKVRALGLSYMHFAQTQPHLFDAMFFRPPDLSQVTKEKIEEGVGSERLLRDTLIEMLEESQGARLSDAQAAVAAFSAWALVHGVSTLLRNGCVDAAIFCESWPEDFSDQHPQSRQAEIIEQLLDIQIAGLKASVQAIRKNP
ncbi:TetR/AcrR family transcriptional regulator [Marinimicrobium alkaliphilum]|uniref:TetR/AcrR family transcriptional regulator n=1 Tax=Marinimicrobium alkaliphilum TaxID=2202654 RepID=UPI000DB97B47|nr:TetR/AcrR family transcriptional regulator [Marinimicrobium alkaliphilum]